MKITIEKVGKKWTVECGCKRIVFGSTESDLFISALLEYINEPEKTIEKYTKEWEGRLIDKITPDDRNFYYQQLCQPLNLSFPQYYEPYQLGFWGI